MKMIGRLLLAAVALLAFAAASATGKDVHHYVFFNRERERIADESFLTTAAIEGAQIKYTWAELEPEESAYDFGAIRTDLEFLGAHGKKLWVQLQDVSFSGENKMVPRYLIEGERFHGGVARQYADDGEPEGWVARRWDPAVQERFHALLAALGKEFDGRIEGINLAETAVTFGDDGSRDPAGFSAERYREAILETLSALKAAFPKSVTMTYANFMPGEWLPEDDHSHLRTVYERARELKVGVGGPDCLPWKRGQMKHSYPLIKDSDGIVPTGIAVQWDNYEHENPRTGKRVTIEEIDEFAREWMKVDEVFWCTQEPYYTEGVLPFLAGKTKSGG